MENMIQNRHMQRTDDNDAGRDQIHAASEKQRLALIDTILDESLSPVARARLLSDGVNANTRLLDADAVIGDQACLACGNCVDACPVVQEKQGFVFVQNNRTSMALEWLVGEECRRCYRCVKACPQVNKDIKEYAAAFRRGEKIVHLLFAMLVVALAFSGISMSHYKGYLPDVDFLILSWVHRILGIALLIMPLVYYFLDKKHLKRLIRKSFSWGKNDRRWVGDLLKHIWNHKNRPLPPKMQFNPGQKWWYLYTMLIVLPLMGVSGLVQWIGLDYGWIREPYVGFFMVLHMIFALLTDCLILIHFYLKYLRNWLIMSYDIIRSLKKNKHLMYSMLYKQNN